MVTALYNSSPAGYGRIRGGRRKGALTLRERYKTLLPCIKSREEKVRGPGPGSPGPNSSLGAEHLLRCSLPGAEPLRREERG